jgi:hypothetical protein
MLPEKSPRKKKKANSRKSISTAVKIGCIHLWIERHRNAC